MTLKMDVLHLDHESWAADGVIPFDRRVANSLAVDEAEQTDVNSTLQTTKTTLHQRLYEDASTVYSVLLLRTSQRV